MTFTPPVELAQELSALQLRWAMHERLAQPHPASHSGCLPKVSCCAEVACAASLQLLHQEPTASKRVASSRSHLCCCCTATTPLQQCQLAFCVRALSCRSAQSAGSWSSGALSATQPAVRHGRQATMTAAEAGLCSAWCGGCLGPAFCLLHIPRIQETATRKHRRRLVEMRHPSFSFLAGRRRTDLSRTA